MEVSSHQPQFNIQQKAEPKGALSNVPILGAISKKLSARSVTEIQVSVAGKNTEGILNKTIQVATVKGFQELNKAEQQQYAPLSLRNISHVDAKSLSEHDIVYVKIDTFIEALGIDKELFTQKVQQMKEQDGASVAAVRIRNKLQEAVENRAFFKAQYNEITKLTSAPVKAESKVRADALLNAAKAHPVSVSSLAKVHSPEFIRARIEGSNSLNPDLGVQKDHNKKAQNWKEADNYVRGLIADKKPLTAKALCEIQRRVEQDSEDEEDIGQFRDIDVKKGDLYYPWSNRTDVTNAAEDILKEIEQELSAYEKGDKSINPIQVAAKAYQKICTLHPFVDGNGRSARFAMDYVLMRCGLPPAAMGSNVLVSVFGPQVSNKYDAEVLENNTNCTTNNALLRVIEGVENSYKLLGIQI